MAARGDHRAVVAGVQNDRSDLTLLLPLGPRRFDRVPSVHANTVRTPGCPRWHFLAFRALRFARKSAGLQGLYDHPVHAGRLLRHHLRDEDRVRVARLPPRQFAARGPEPGEQLSLHRPEPTRRSRRDSDRSTGGSAQSSGSHSRDRRETARRTDAAIARGAESWSGCAARGRGGRSRSPVWR